MIVYLNCHYVNDFISEICHHVLQWATKNSGPDWFEFEQTAHSEKNFILRSYSDYKLNTLTDQDQDENFRCLNPVVRICDVIFGHFDENFVTEFFNVRIQLSEFVRI